MHRITHHLIVIMEIIIGAAVSLLVQWLKQRTSNEWETLAVLLIVSLAAAAGYTALVATGYWQAVGGIIVTAGAFYSFVLQRFENQPGQAATPLFSPDEISS